MIVRKSNHSASDLERALVAGVDAYQDSTDQLNAAVGEALGLNRTDIRCLRLLSQAGPLSASQLAEAAGLSRSAMTTVLDRIETAGYAQRVRDQADRRSVQIELTEFARQQFDAVYGPTAEQEAYLLASYTAAELATVLRFLQDEFKLQLSHAARIRQLGERRQHQPGSPAPE